MNAATLVPIVRDAIARETYVMTDEHHAYTKLSDHLAGHGTTNHKSGEYVRGIVHSNTVKGYFSIFKRGMKGVYQHCPEKHLHRYLAEFDFRYNHRVANGFDASQRGHEALAGITGKRLTYARPDERA